MKRIKILFLLVVILLFSFALAKMPKAEYVQEPEPTIQQRSSEFYRTSPKPSHFENVLRRMNAGVEAEKAYNRRMIGRLYIPEQEIYVALYDCVNFFGDWQYITDLEDSSCYFTIDPPHIMIGDHCTQEFARLPEVESGDMAYIIRGDSIEKLLCVALIDGHNTGEHITDGDYSRVDNLYDYICYTCINGWRNIRIVGFESLGYVPTENNTIKIYAK